MTDHESVCDMGCDKECTLSYCSVCGEDWPCETVQLRATIARVQEYVDDLERRGCLSCSSLTGGDELASDLRAALKGEKS